MFGTSCTTTPNGGAGRGWAQRCSIAVRRPRVDLRRKRQLRAVKARVQKARRESGDRAGDSPAGGSQLERSTRDHDGSTVSLIPLDAAPGRAARRKGANRPDGRSDNRPGGRTRRRTQLTIDRESARSIDRRFRGNRSVGSVCGRWAAGRRPVGSVCGRWAAGRRPVSAGGSSKGRPRRPAEGRAGRVRQSKASRKARTKQREGPA